MDKFKFLLAELHRAQHQGARTIEITVTELSDLLARIESLEARESTRLNGRHLGFATGHKMDAMLAGARKYITVSAYKSDTFDQRVTCPEIGK